MSVRLLTHHEDETMELARRLGRLLQGGDCITLEGPLGSGKTCFVRGLAMGLGIDPSAVSSPTFTLCQTYDVDHAEGPKIDEHALMCLHHIDAYRLEGGDDLDSFGFDEMHARGDAVCAIEWPSRIADRLPRSRIDIAFGHVNEVTRELHVTPTSLATERMLAIEEACRRPIRTYGVCPGCRKSVPRRSDSFPFCSERCRMSDLGDWFSERFVVSRAIEEDDLTDGTLEP